MSAKPLRHTMAKVEFLGCLDRVESMLAQGFSKKIVYETLLGERRLTMAYVTFCKLSLRASRNSLLPPARQASSAVSTNLPKPPPPPSAPKPAQNSGPRIVKTEQTPFPDPRKMRVEDAI